ncbi:YD repeat-containing protein, partial [Duganella sp. CF458]|uniref:Ig-like domain repeat protein n=1 Tax=Duganella sp. CF458 TaxID=1884368 RepID=UPI0008F3421C
TLTSDAWGRLIKMQAPALANGSSPSVAYSYDAAGNMLTQVDGTGAVTKYEYDAFGNQTKVTDAMGNITERTYSNGLLTSENISFNQSVQYAGYRKPQTVRMVYDAARRLRFTVDREGGVTEYRYDAMGQRISSIAYTGDAYAGTVYGEGDLAGWVTGRDKSRTVRTDTAYDFRGQVSQVTKWNAIDASGNGVADGKQSVTNFVYSQAGQLLQTIAPDSGTTSLTYDGLGRVLNRIDDSGAITSTVYDDAGHKSVLRMANGLVTTSTFNEAGLLVSLLQSDGSSALGESKYFYDAVGRLRVTQGADGAKSAVLYDASGRKTGEVSATGALTEYIYDANNHLVHTVRYATAVHPALLVSTATDLGMLDNRAALERALGWTVDALRPQAGAQDVKSWNFYDVVGRLAWQVDGMGYATQTLYDGASNAYAVNRLSTPIDTSQLGNGLGVTLKLGGNTTSVQLAEVRGAGNTRTYAAVVTGQIPVGAAGAPSGTVTFFAGSTLLGSAVVRSGVASFTGTIPAGHSDISAVYSGDGGNFGSTSNSIATDAVVLPATSITLSADSTSVRFGSPLQLTATVTGAAPGGVVAFFSGEVSLGFGALVNGVARLSATNVPVGQGKLTAVYLGDAGNAGSTSAMLEETVEKARPTVVLSTSRDQTESGGRITLTALVDGPNPQGTVTFYDQANAVVGTANLIRGRAELVVTNLPAGTEKLVAVYNGDANNASVASAAIDERVARVTSHTSLYVARNDTVFGNVTSLFARVTGFNPAGIVSFFDGNHNLLGTSQVINGEARLSVANSNVPLAEIIASYAGDAANTISTSDQVNNARAGTGYTYSEFNSSQYSTVTAGETFYFSFVTNGPRPAGGASLYDMRGNLLGRIDGANSYSVYRFTVENTLLPAGDQVLTMVQDGDTNIAPSVASGVLHVRRGAVQIKASVFDNSAVEVGQTKTVTVTLDNYGKRPIGGTVTFTDTTTNVVLGTVPVVNGVAALAVEAQWSGAGHTIRTDYSGDDYNSADYTATTVTADPAPPLKPAMTLSTNVSSVVQGGNVTITATLSGPNNIGTPLVAVLYSGMRCLNGQWFANGSNTVSWTMPLDQVGTMPLRVVYYHNDSYSLSGQYKLMEQNVSNEVNVQVTPNASYVPPVETKPAPPLAISIDTKNTSAVGGASITDELTFKATFTDGFTSRQGAVVAFFNGDKLIGVAQTQNHGSTAILKVGHLPPGDYKLTAKFSSDGNARQVESPVMNFTVARAVTSTSLIVTQTLNKPKDTVTMLAKVAGPLTLGGRMKFFNGNQLIAEVDVKAGLAKLETVLPEGVADLRAEYAGDAASQGSVSTSVRREVIGNGAEVSLAASTLTSEVGAPVILTARVAGHQPGGAVAFFAGNKLLGSAYLIGGVATLSVDQLSLGEQQLVAVYGGDTNNAGATSATVTETVVRSSKPLVLTTSRTEANAGTLLALRAAFGDAGVTGKVKFMNGDTLLGSVDIVNGEAILEGVRLPAGSNALRAVYAGDDLHVASTSEVVMEEAAKVPTLVHFNTPGRVPYGSPFVLTARVDGDHPTGKVVFHSGAFSDAPYGVADIIDGVATLVVTRPIDVQNRWAATAYYLGDAYNAPNASAASATDIIPASPVVTMAASPASVRLDEPVVITASVPRTGTMYPEGTISFYDGNTLLRTVNTSAASGVVQITLRNLGAGSHNLTAKFTKSHANYADSIMSAPVAVQVQAVATTTLTMAAGSATAVAAEQPFTASVTIGGGSAPSGLVTFSVRDSKSVPATVRVVGTASVVNGVASLTLAASAFSTLSGQASIIASYAGDASNKPAVNAVGTVLVTTPVAVQAPGAGSATTVSLSSSNQSGPHGTMNELAAQLGTVDGVPATGTVTFFNGTELLGSVTLLDGVARFKTNALPVATNKLTAVYSGDANYAQSVSNLVTQTTVAATDNSEVEVTYSSDTVSTSSGKIAFKVRLLGAHQDGTMEVYIDGKLDSTQTMVDGVMRGFESGWTWDYYKVGGVGPHTVRFVFKAAGGTAATATDVKVNVVNTPSLPRPGISMTAAVADPIKGSDLTQTIRITGNNPTGTVFLWNVGSWNSNSPVLAAMELVNGVATFTSRDIPVGSSADWIVCYSGDANNATAADAYQFGSRSVVKINYSVTTLQSDTVVTPAGTEQRLTALVTGDHPSGSVTFYDQYGNVLGVVDVKESEVRGQGIATLTLSNVQPGRACIRASYSGDAANKTSVASLTDDLPEPTTVTITSSDPLPKQGFPVTLSVRVNGAQPGGMVQFFDGANNVIGRSEVVNGVATLTLGKLPAGQSSFTVHYLGDEHNAFSVGSFVQNVAQAQTHISLSTAHENWKQGQPLILTAKVEREGAGFASGTVTFYNGAEIIGTSDVYNGLAAVTVTTLPVGVNKLSVRFSGDNNNQGCASEPITQAIELAPQPGSLAFTSSVTGSAPQGTSITLTAKPNGTAGNAPGGIVTFMHGGDVLGTAPIVDGAAKFTFVASKVMSGALGAVYSGDAANAGNAMVGNSSYNLQVTLKSGVALPPAPATTPTSVVLSVSNTEPVYGEPLTLSLRVTVRDAAKPATGMVVFYDDANVVGCAMVKDGIATMTSTNFYGGGHNFKAVYSGDSNNAPVVSGQTTVYVNSAKITPTLILSSDHTNAGEIVRVVAQIKDQPALLERPDLKSDQKATVYFYRGSTYLGGCQVKDGLAYLSFNSGIAVSEPIRAEYVVNWVSRADSASAPAPLVTDTPKTIPRLVVSNFSSSPSSLYGTAVSFNVRLVEQSGAVRYNGVGTFTFYNGNQLVGSAKADSNASGTILLEKLPVGANQLRAVYSGNNGEEPVSSLIFTQYVTKPQPDVSYQGQTAADGTGTYTYTVGNGKQPVPTGTITIFSRDGQQRIASATVVDGKAVLIVPPGRWPGDAKIHSYYAFEFSYSGDENYAPRSSSSTAYTPSQYLTASLTGVPGTEPGTFVLAAKVAGANPGGYVSFRDQYGNFLGSAALNSSLARITVKNLLGDLSGVKGYYSGDEVNPAVTINYSPNADAARQPTVTTVSTAAAAVQQGGKATLSARVSGGNGNPTGTVNFYDGTILLGVGTLVNGVATISTGALVAGLNQVTAMYSGDASNAVSMSGSIDETLMAAPVSVILNKVTAPVVQGTSLTLTAAVTGNVPSGKVTFISGKTVLGVVDVNAGAASLFLPRVDLPAGEHTIIASYSGDTENQAMLSSSFTLTVTPGLKTVSLGQDTTDRKVQQYFNKNGQVRATINAEGFMTEYRYDAAGRLVQTIAYANAAAPKVIDLTKDDADLFSMAPIPAANAADIHSFVYYDKKGQKSGEVNGEGYLTEYSYDTSGRLETTRRYANKALGTPSAASALDALRPVASSEDQVTTSKWNKLGQLASRTNADGSITTFSYDNVGALTGTTVAKGSSDERTVLKRYDLQGRVVAELPGTGVALLRGDMDTAAVDDVWAAHATTYTYDASGHRTSMKDALGNRSLFFYDDAGRLRFAVNAAGNVTESEYDTLGRLSATTAYATSVPADALAALQGGVLSAAATAVTALATAKSAALAQNSVTRFAYNTDNELVQTTNAAGGVNKAVYNAFGQVVASTEGTDNAGNGVTTLHTYDRRGLETGTNTLREKIYHATSAQYDAFGRLVRSVDANGNVSQQGYDKLGQVVTTTDPLNGKRSASYDAFGRVLTQTDALSRVTTHSYNTAERSTTVTTPEGVSVTTTQTRTGQTHSVKDGNGNVTTYSYDQDGKLLAVDSALADTSSEYDAAGQLIKSRDANGNEVTYTYDSAHRLFTRTVDVAGVKLVTRYGYDAKGQRVSVTDSNGTVTRMDYDLTGQVMTQVVDPDGLKLTTRYTHDVRGNTLTVTSAGGTTMQYVYDDLGRRI